MISYYQVRASLKFKLLSWSNCASTKYRTFSKGGNKNLFSWHGVVHAYFVKKEARHLRQIISSAQNKRLILKGEICYNNGRFCLWQSYRWIWKIVRSKMNNEKQRESSSEPARVFIRCAAKSCISIAAVSVKCKGPD